jgi:quinol-cytochrome oxidoreductase complex cytochrome b subunit
VSEADRTFVPVPSEDARRVPVRVALAQDESRFTVEEHDEPTAMTVPHLLVREAVALLGLSLGLVLLSLLFDAPLEEMANPDVTPNPAKAPWYFLGLQELLHYYPPFVAGVLLPTLVVLSLVVVPYFDVNLTRRSLWTGRSPARTAAVLLATAGLCLLFVVTAKHPVWPIIVPTILVGALAALPGIAGARGRLIRWLAGRSIPFWIFTWFVLVAVVLTVIGTLFRGPGWSFTLPWRDGVY